MSEFMAGLEWIANHRCFRYRLQTIDVSEDLSGFLRRRVVDFGQDNFGDDASALDSVEKTEKPMHLLRPIARRLSRRRVREAGLAMVVVWRSE